LITCSNNPSPCWVYIAAKILNVNEAALKYLEIKEEFLSYTALQLIASNDVPQYENACKSISKMKTT
jgi:hypothetical protein